MGDRGARRAPAAVAPRPLSTGLDAPVAWDDRVLLAVILVLGAALRAWLPFGHVFTRTFVNLQTNDSWYHARLIDNLVRNFPHPLHVDVYAAPQGAVVAVAPLFDFLVAATAWATALGSPTVHAAEVVGAWAPVGFALATIVATFLVGRSLFDPLTGLLAAALLATMPGPLLDRTVLGYVDHHAAEACFSAFTLLALAVALQRSRAGRPSGRYGAGAGLALGLYLLTWTSGSFLVFIIAAWAGLQYILDSFGVSSSDRVARLVATAAGVAALLLVLFEDSRVPQHGIRLGALAATVVGVAGLEGLRQLWRRARWRPTWFVFGVAGVTAAAAAVCLLAAPGLAAVALDNLGRLAPDAAAQTVGEVRPLFSVDVASSALRAWSEFRTTFFLAVPGLALLAADVWRRRIEERALLLVWTLVTLAATIGQNRFGYYLALELALLAAWLSARLLRWAGATVVNPRMRLAADAAVVLVAAVVFYPSIPPALQTARWDFGVPPPWREALLWMRDATPEPFQNPHQYYARDPAGPIAPAYTVMNWWDYGYWLMRIAHRVPVSNPTQVGAFEAARFFTETDPVEAARLLEADHARYIVAGEELPMRLVASAEPSQRWFEAMPLWAHRSRLRYSETFYERSASGALVPIVVFNPDYYRTMMSRLYLFGGDAAQPRASTWIITFDARVGTSGQAYREITASRRFDTYEAAQVYLADLGPGQHRLVGLDPRATCVPLPALERFGAVFQSTERSAAFPGVPAVRIFELRTDPRSAN